MYLLHLFYLAGIEDNDPGFEHDLRGTPCHTPDDGSTHIQKAATDGSTMSTAMMQSLLLARRKHGPE